MRASKGASQTVNTRNMVAEGPLGRAPGASADQALRGKRKAGHLFHQGVSLRGVVQRPDALPDHLLPDSVRRGVLLRDGKQNHRRDPLHAPEQTGPVCQPIPLLGDHEPGVHRKLDRLDLPGRSLRGQAGRSAACRCGPDHDLVPSLHPRPCKASACWPRWSRTSR